MRYIKRNGLYILIVCVLLFNVLARVLGKFLARRLTAE